METFIGIVIAVVAVTVSALQYEANRTKLKYDLFERRRSVYDKIEEYNSSRLPEANKADEHYSRLEELRAINRLVDQLFEHTAYEHATSYLSCLEAVVRLWQEEIRLREEIKKHDDGTYSERWQELNNAIVNMPLHIRWPSQGASAYYNMLMDELAKQMKIVEPPRIIEMPGKFKGWLWNHYKPYGIRRDYYPFRRRLKDHWQNIRKWYERVKR